LGFPWQTDACFDVGHAQFWRVAQFARDRSSGVFDPVDRLLCDPADAEDAAENENELDRDHGLLCFAFLLLSLRRTALSAAFVFAAAIRASAAMVAAAAIFGRLIGNVPACAICAQSAAQTAALSRVNRMLPFADAHDGHVGAAAAYAAIAQTDGVDEADLPQNARDFHHPEGFGDLPADGEASVDAEKRIIGQFSE
jgi:hypothetical protein